MEIVKIEDALKNEVFCRMLLDSNLFKFINFIEFKKEVVNGETIRNILTIKVRP